MAAATSMTVEEFAALPEDGRMHELVEGELLSMPPPHSLHTKILHRIFLPMAAFIFLPMAAFVLKERLGETFAEAGYQLHGEPPTVRQPDVSFLSSASLAKQPPDGCFRGSADLVVEIVSPSDRADDLDSKVRQYLEAGSKAVVVVYPQTRSVWVHRPQDSPKLLSAGRDLELPDVLPGWFLPVAEVFAPLGGVEK